MSWTFARGSSDRGEKNPSRRQVVISTWCAKKSSSSVKCRWLLGRGALSLCIAGVSKSAGTGRGWRVVRWHQTLPHAHILHEAIRK